MLYGNGVGWGGDELGWSGGRVRMGGVCVGWGWNRGMNESRAGSTPLQAVVENVNITGVRWL